jgi:hypothetical protein
MLLSLKKVSDANGFAHFIAPLIVVLVVGVVGTYFLVSSHAQSASNSKTGLVVVKAYTESYGCAYASGGSASETNECPLIASHEHIIVMGASAGATCMGINVHNGSDLGSNRRLRCSPGTYSFALANATILSKWQGHKKHDRSIPAIRTVPVQIGHPITIKLASGIAPQK